MNALLDLVKNNTSIVSMIITAMTGLLTGPIFHWDAAAVGSVTGVVALVANLWVYTQVYSKKGAALVATVAATNAVAAVSGDVAGEIGQVTAAAKQTIDTAVETAVGAAPPPGS